MSAAPPLALARYDLNDHFTKWVVEHLPCPEPLHVHHIRATDGGAFHDHSAEDTP